MKNKKILIVLLLLTILSGAAFVAHHCYQDYQQAKEEKILLAKRRASWTALQQILAQEVGQFKGEFGIIIKDLKMDWELYFNKDRLFPSASLVKVPIMLACFQAAQEGRINLGQTLQLKAPVKTAGSGILKEMPTGSKFTVEQLIEIMISESDNTAANMLINLLDFDYLNNCFKELNLKNTNLSRKMMDFRERKNGKENYATARDMAYILEKIYRREFLSRTVSEQCLLLLKKQQINDRIPGRLPSDVIVAHKTGLERKICHDVGIIFTPQEDFLICVLTQNAESHKIAKRFISNVALSVYEYSQQF